MSDPHIELNNRSYAWLGGLLSFVVMALMAAFFVGSGDKVELSTIYTSASGSESAAGIDDDLGFDDADQTGALVESPVSIPTAAPSVFAAALPTEAPTPLPTLVPTVVATATPVPDPVETGDTATDASDGTDTTDTDTTNDSGAETEGDTTTDTGDGADTVLATPGPEGVVEPTPVPTRTGPGEFRTQSLEADGATVEKNSVVVKIDESGSGTAVGELEVSWPDGQTLSLSFDDAFEFDTNYDDIRVGLNAEFTLDSPNDDEDETDQRGTMRIPNPDLRIGAICVATCLTFDY